MGRFSQLIVLTVVQVFVTAGWAQPPAVPAKRPEPAAPQGSQTNGTVSATTVNESNVSGAGKQCEGLTKYSEEWYTCLSRVQGINGVSETEKRCQDAFNAFTKANNEFNSSCNEASLGGECREAVEECYDKSGATEFSTLGAAASAFGLQGVGDLQKKCPDMTYEKWETSHDKLESKMTKAKDSLVEVNKQVDAAKKQYNETNSKLAKEYNELNKEQAKKALQANSDKRKAEVDAQETIRKVKDALFNNSMKIQDLRLQVSNAYIQKASNIAAASQGLAMANFKCTDELQQKLSKMGTISSKAFGNLMANGSSSSNSKKAMWQDCMRAFLKARDQQAQTDAARVSALESQIANAEETGKYLQDSLKTVETQIAESKKEVITGEQQDQKDYEARVKEIRTAMSNNLEESSATMKTLNENQKRLQEDVTRTSNAFMASTSGMPETGSSSTFRKASAKYGEMHAAGIAAQDVCTCKLQAGGKKSPIASTTLCKGEEVSEEFRKMTNPSKGSN